jgi:hypothetical protein
MLNDPEDKNAVYYVWKRGAEKLGSFIGYREFVIDQSAGDILRIAFRLGEGCAGVSGGACVSSAVLTGVLRWLQKRGAKRRVRSLGKVRSRHIEPVLRDMTQLDCGIWHMA